MRRVLVSFVAVMLFLPFSFAHAASFSYGAWIPYWKKTAAIPETLAHIDVLSTISPFAYEVRPNGTIRDAMRLKDVSWLSLMETAGSRGVKIVPSFSWQNGDEIHKTLASSTARNTHEDAILKIVDENDFDGVDIDYENKKAETKKYFSQFVTELSRAMHARKKTLACTIEPRTPASSRFVKVPKVLEYANDFAVLNKACDEVRIMAYEQGRIDLLLNKAKGAGGAFYAPIADREWVEKVVKEALKTISRTKLVLGVANFGDEYEMNEGAYRNTRSMSYAEAATLASSTGGAFTRNRAGEAQFSYVTSAISSAATSTRFVVVSDAKAIADKVALAKKYKLKGAFLFKIDGESDLALWSALK